VQRAKAIAAGRATPTPQELLSQHALLERIARSLERLEKAADGAAASDLYVPLAGLSGQLHKAVETAAKLQGIGNEPVVEQSRVSVNIVLSKDYAAETPTVRLQAAIPLDMEYSVRDTLMDPTADAIPDDHDGDCEESMSWAFKMPSFTDA